MRLIKSLFFPYLKRFWLMLLSVALVGAFGCGILIGLRNSFHALNDGVNLLIDECGYPDLYAKTVSDIDQSYLSYLPDDFNSYMGIEKAEYRTTYNTTFNAKENSYSARLIGYNDLSIAKHHAVDGELKYTSIRMEYYFAKSNGFKVGDVLSTKMPDGSMYNLKIDATIVSPEASIVKADPYSISSSRDFAYIYVPESLIDAHSPTLYFNEILFKFKEGQKKNLDETIDLLEQYAKEKVPGGALDDLIEEFEKSIAFATTYDDAEPIVFYNEALKSLNLITISAPAVFFVVVLIVTALFLFQIVKQCRKDIGIMRALGESPTSISLVYLSISLFIGIVSWIIGIGIGSIFTIIANTAYGEALKLFPLSFMFDIKALSISLGIILFVTLFTALLASLNLAKIKPVEAMKALPPSKNNTPLLTRTVFKKAPISLKVTISQTLRNFARYAFSGICLLSSAMLVFIALSLGQSKEVMMAQLFKTRLNYDVQVYFDNMPSDEEIAMMFPSEDTNITDKTLIKYIPSVMINTKNDKTETGLVNGLKDDQDLIRVIDDGQNVISVPKEGIILSTYHAYKLDAKVGDTLLVDDQELEVKAISNEYLYQVSYTSFDSYNPETQRGSLVAKVNDVQAFFNTYKDVDHVTYISFTNIIHGEFNDRLAAFSISSVILTFMSIVVGFMIVFNMMQTNLKEQKRTFATMRTLGYQRQSISLANLSINIFQYLIAMVFAIPLGILITKTLLRAISVPDQIYPFPKTLLAYIASTIIVLAFLLLSHFLVMNSMKKWNLPEEVKERE